jgi:hypothetical protein
MTAIALLALMIAHDAATADTAYVGAQASSHLERALEYLRSVYNNTVGLMSEQPYGDAEGRKLYWLNDNIFVYAALKAHGTGSDVMLADRVRADIIQFTEMLNLPHYEDGFPELGIHEVILGYPIQLPLPCYSSKLVAMGSYMLGFVIANGTRERECVVEDFNGFADMILYQSIAAFYSGSLTDARNLFQDVVMMWDGHGIADSPYRNPSDPQYQRYATYKLALLLYVAEKLNATNSLPFLNQISDTIWSMQAYNGGIITNYMEPNLPIGVVNTETTALVVLANPPIPTTTTTTIFTTVVPLWAVTLSEYMAAVVALIAILLVLNVATLAFVIRKRRR